MIESLHTLTTVATFDITKLISIVKNYKSKRIKIKSIRIYEAMKSRKSGYCKKRYIAADISYPLLVGERLELIDGRHRLLKLMAMKRKICSVIIVPYWILGQCIFELE